HRPGAALERGGPGARHRGPRPLGSPAQRQPGTPPRGGDARLLRGDPGAPAGPARAFREVSGEDRIAADSGGAMLERAERQDRRVERGGGRAHPWAWGVAGIAVAVAIAALVLGQQTVRRFAPAASPAPVASAAPAVERLRVKVLAVHPHDPTCYTQG